MTVDLTLVLVRGPTEHVEKTLRSLARQTVPIKAEIVTASSLDPAVIHRSGLIAEVRPCWKVPRRPDLRGCQGEWVAVVTPGDEWPADRLET